jgi:hypothetical protein
MSLDPDPEHATADKATATLAATTANLVGDRNMGDIPPLT